jgi:hypothetical protein
MTVSNWHDYTNKKARRGQANRKAFLLNELKGMTLHIDHLVIRYNDSDTPEAMRLLINRMRLRNKEMMDELETITYP